MRKADKAAPKPRGQNKTGKVIFSSPMERAVNLFGSLTGLADRLGVSYQRAQRWRKDAKIPAQYVIAIELACDTRITRYELRPDVFYHVKP